MAQPINTNTFFENIHLTDQNSLTHLLDFDEEHSDLSNVLKTSLVFFFVTKKTTLCCHSRCLSVRPSVLLSVRPSSVEISLERGSKRSAKPIDLKIGLDIDN